MSGPKSDALFRKARKLMPGGVNSPVRAFKSVGGEPLFFHRGSGAFMYDVDGTEYVDYVLSWGPLLLGHAHPNVVEAITTAAAHGTSFGAPNPYEVELAELVQDFFPSLELVRMVNSGTEATMSALRVARAHTGRDLVAKFEGCYHGAVDNLLVKAGSGLLTLNIPATPGVPEAVANLTLTLPYNDEAALEKLFEQEGERLAAVIIEPVIGNSGCIPPASGFLEKLRSLCTKHGTVLIFDEVMTGFRVSRGGAQGRFGIKPDLTTFGKVIGGGLPVGAYGGKKEIMERIAPSGDVYQAGTLSGNPLAMAAGLATLRTMGKDATRFDEIEATTNRLVAGLLERANRHGVSIVINHVGSMFTIFFREHPVTSPEEAMKADVKLYGRFFNEMLSRGVYFPPSQFEASFVSSAHDEKVIERTLAAADEAFAALAPSPRSGQ